MLYPLFVTATSAPIVPVNELVVIAGDGFKIFVTHSVKLYTIVLLVNSPVIVIKFPLGEQE
jgi:hypothetical protein